MNNTDTSSSQGGTGLQERIRSAFEAISGRSKAAADAGKQKVADRRDARKRSELLRELGELYYDALSLGRDGPSPALRDRVIADLDALDPLERSRPGDDAGEAEEGASTDEG